MKALLILWFCLVVVKASAIEAANSCVRIRTSCPDVLSIKPVGKDFHLLVTNASACAHVEVEAVPPWSLVRPASGYCDVALSATGLYEVGDSEPDELGNREPNKCGSIIMFKPTFVVSPDFPSGMSFITTDSASLQTREVALPGSEGDLTDNHTATVTYIPIGAVPTLRGHTAAMLVRPQESGSSLLHHPSVDPNSVFVDVDVRRTEWKSSKVYWYGVRNHPSNAGCCYKTKFNYIFDLVVDGFTCYTRTYNVGWPRSTPGMLARVVEPSVSITIEQFVDEDEELKWKARICFSDFIKEGQIANAPYICQYREQILAEENYHRSQFEGRVDVAHGGNPDLFTAKGIIYCARQNDFYYGFLEGSDIIVQDNDVYVIGDTYNEVAVYANSIKNWAIESERQESWRYVQARRLWAEYQAKMEVNYNAAWRYHCTYGNGSETPPFYEIHPAYR
jgi:hypothetical protein